MTDDSRVDLLLMELMESGGDPEEACRSCPELLPLVRVGLRRLQTLEAEIGGLFPVTTVPEGGASLPSTTDLPRIPGYEVQGLLGHGGMGIVYKAWHLSLHRPVAVKMLLAGAYARPRELERFRREAAVVAGLRHPHIVQVYDVADLDGRPYFTMEFVEGCNLAQKIAGAPQPARQAAAIVAGVAEAVHAAHVAGIVHRDLKPANILLSADGTPKLTDFGLARRLEGEAGLTQSGARLGTPSYMAPEQAEGRSSGVGPAADTYALGAILYELLTGRPPFRADTAAETLRQVMAHDPVPPSRLNAAVPRDAETICLKCLEKDPRLRYASSAALAEDLRRFGRNEPIMARPVGAWEHGLRWMRRNPTLTALSVMALVLVALTAAGMGRLMQERAERRADLRSGIAQAISLRNRFHFHEARQLLEQAQERLGPGDLRQQVDEALADLELVENLDRARLRAKTLIQGRLESSQAEPIYLDALTKAGLGQPGDDCDTVAARVVRSAVCPAIVTALDDWASITEDEARQAWLLTIARLADPDPSRDQLRQPELWRDGPRLTALVRELQGSDLSPQLATALGRVLRKSDEDAVPFFSAAQARFPQDFWLNFELGLTLTLAGRHEESLGFYRAALAIRPEAAPTHVAIGLSLSAMGRLDEAIDHFQKAIDGGPDYPLAHNNLGFALWAKGRRDEAIAQYRECVRLTPKDARALLNLGSALRNMGRLDEAIDSLQQSVQADPNLTLARHNLYVCRFAAACIALRDAEGQVSAEAERARLRQQALDLLRANLESRAEVVNRGKVETWSFADWRIDPILAGVRDQGKLPDAERQRWQHLWDDLAIVLADPLEKGKALAARRDWKQAANCYAGALKGGTTDDGPFWFEYAALLLLSGDRPGYNTACDRMIQWHRKTLNLRPYHLARACTLAAGAVADASLPGRVAEGELKGSSGQFWSLTQQGALNYRAGQFPQAVALFEQSLRADPNPGRAVLNWLWLALAQQSLGNSEESRRWLDKATQWLDQLGEGMPDRAERELGLHFHNWLEAHILRREAEAMIRPVTPR